MAIRAPEFCATGLTLALLEMIVAGLVAPQRLNAAFAQDSGLVRLGSLVVQVGEESGSPDREFGYIERAKLLSGNRVVVLDSRLNVIRTFDTSGRHHASASRPGSGPGELRHVTGLELVGGGDVLVLDVGKAEAIRFSWQDGAWRFAGSHRVDPTAEDLCAIGSSTFVVGNSVGEKSIVHVFDASGSKTSSFGEPLVTGSPMRQVVLSKGLRATCLSERRILVVAGRWVPQVRAYSSDGRLLWSHELDGFSAAIVEERGQGASFKPPASGRVHLLAGIGRLSEEILYVQVGLMTQKIHGRERYAELSTHWLRASDGLLIGIQRNLPLIADANHEYLLFRDNEDVPRFSVYRYQFAPK